MSGIRRNAGTGALFPRRRPRRQLLANAGLPPYQFLIALDGRGERDDPNGGAYTVYYDTDGKSGSPTDAQKAALKEVLTPSPDTGNVLDQDMPASRKSDYMFACAQSMIAATRSVPAIENTHMHSPWRLSVVRNGRHPRVKCEIFGEALGDGYVEADVLCHDTTKERCSRPVRVVLGAKAYFPGR